jgi:hypothetical protein
VPPRPAWPPAIAITVLAWVKIRAASCSADSRTGCVTSAVACSAKGPGPCDAGSKYGFLAHRGSRDQ